MSIVSGVSASHLPLIAVLLLSSPICAVLGFLWSRIPHAEVLVHGFGVLGPLVGAGAALALAVGIARGGAVTGGGVIYADALSAVLLVVIALVSALAALYSIPYLARERRRGNLSRKQVGWYYGWAGLLLAAMYATPLVNSLGLQWVLIEATTLLSVPLVALRGGKERIEAAWKYVVIATVGISFALLGILLLYVAASARLPESAAMFDVTYLQHYAPLLDPSLVKVAFLLVLVGYGTKAGLAPMHTWLPDAHSQAPTPISALLSGALLSCALYALLRVSAIARDTLGAPFPMTLFIIFGLLSLATAVPFLLRQDDVKRLLAYSSVEHMGIVVLAVGIGGTLGQFAALLHLLAHAVSKAVMFCIAGEVTERFHTRRIAQIRGVARAAPLLGALLFVGAFAISGVPPFTIFLSELLTVEAAMLRGQFWVALLAALLLGAVFAGILRQVARMALGEPTAAPVADTLARDYPGDVLGVQARPLPPQAVADVALVGTGRSAGVFAASALRDDQHGSASGSYPSNTWLAGMPAEPAPPHEGTAPRLPDPLHWEDRAALLLLSVAVIVLLILGVWLPQPLQQLLRAAGAVLP